jgi:lipopolysaccharide/colanic/teichoic acid biosynthesis glycosyltransferase
MTRWVKSLIPLVTLLTILGIAEVHARFIGHYPLTQLPRFGWELGYIGLTWVTAYAAGLPDVDGTWGAVTLRSFGAAFAAALGISLLQLLSATPLLPRFVVLASVVVLTPLYVATVRAAERSAARRGEQDRVLALVAPEEGEILRREMARAPERPAVLVGVHEPSSLLAGGAPGEELVRLVNEEQATVLVLDREAQQHEELLAEVARLHSKGMRVRTLTLFYDEWLGKLPISELERVSLFFDINEVHRVAYARIKRALDVLLALGLLPALLAAVPVVALLDLVGNRGPLLYRQERVGKDGIVFTILKFRTLAPHNGPTDWTAATDPRIGRVGHFLRRTHLDELPQVLNVLRRDLSVVGPRPEQPRYVAQLREVIPYYDVRHLVRPGITGWAQVKYPYGASELDALEKLQYEFYYLRHQSLGLDLRIIGRTLRSFALGQGR